MKYYYSIEMFKEGKWVKEVRIYHIEKSLTDFDLIDIPNKRKNATKLTR